MSTMRIQAFDWLRARRVISCLSAHDLVSIEMLAAMITSRKTKGLSFVLPPFGFFPESEALQSVRGLGKGGAQRSIQATAHGVCCSARQVIVLKRLFVAQSISAWHCKEVCAGWSSPVAESQARALAAML